MPPKTPRGQSTYVSRARQARSVVAPTVSATCGDGTGRPTLAGGGNSRLDILYLRRYLAH